MTTSTKVNSFTISKTKNQFILLCWKKQLWRMCTNFWINPHTGKLPSRLAPAQCQNSLAPQLLSNIYWSKTKTSISLNRVYWYDTMCHIFSCLLRDKPHHRATPQILHGFRLCYSVLFRVSLYELCHYFTKDIIRVEINIVLYIVHNIPSVLSWKYIIT